MLDVRLYLLQRISALIMIPLVFGHLALMIYAIQDGLTAGEILGRTQGSLFWFAYYSVFVVAVSVHGAIGLRAICFEWFGLRRHVNALTLLVCGGLLYLGISAVLAVTG